MQEVSNQKTAKVNILLQIQAAYEQSLATRLTDQLFSVVLLVGFAIYSLQRQKQIEKKLEKYMEEDREEMKEVIMNNTKAFEMFNNKVIKLATLVLFSLFFLSCTTVKKRSESTTMLEQKHSDVSVNRQDLVSEKVKEKDSAITVPERKVEGTLSGDQLKPSYNDKGEAKPNTTHIEGKGIDIKATVNKDGSITIKGSCDSLTLIVRNLRTELREKNSKLDSISQQKERIVYVKQQRLVKKVYPSGLMLAGLWISGAAVGFFLSKGLPTIAKRIFG